MASTSYAMIAHLIAENFKLRTELNKRDIGLIKMTEEVRVLTEKHQVNTTCLVNITEEFRVLNEHSQVRDREYSFVKRRIIHICEQNRQKRARIHE